MVLFFWISNSNPVNLLYCLAFGWSVGSGLLICGSRTPGLQRFDILFLASLLMSLPTYVMCVWNPVYLTLELVLIFMLISFIAPNLIGTKVISNICSTRTATIDGQLTNIIVLYALNLWVVMLLWNLMWYRGEIPFVRMYHGDTGLGQYSASITIFGGGQCV